MSKPALPKGEFDASKHLLPDMPDIVSMEEIGYAADTGVSPVAVSTPFRLFSQGAVNQMRREVFHVRENHQEHVFSSNIAACQLRGYVPKYAPFTYDAWTHPDTIKKISKIAGMDLVPWSNYEIAHINFSTKTQGQVQTELAEHESRKRAHVIDDDDKPIVGWHKDSYPFVCVLMLSDCSTMIGGETALLKGNGEVVKVRGPEMGCAVVLQGRYITHQALRALGATERITAVTSFRPKSAVVRDDTVLNTVRPISDLSQLYYDFAEYRFEMLAERANKQLKQMRAMSKGGKQTNVAAIRKFIEEQQAMLTNMTEQILPYEEVEAGVLPEEDLPNDAPAEAGAVTPPDSENEAKRSKMM